LSVVEATAEELPVSESKEAVKGVNKKDQRAGDETSEVWISADLGDDQTKRRGSKCQEDLPIVA
jgi:hypothetical protein